MPYKVLYIDDEKIERSQAFADGLSSLSLVEIEVITPTSFEDLISELIEKQSQFEALILDLKLDGNQKGDRVAKYTAPSLASGVRSRCHGDSGFIKEFPIFLISSSENLKKYYNSDTSSHDLFDYTFNKTKISQKGQEYEKLINSIIITYSTIQENKINFKKILGEPNEIDIEEKLFSSRFLNGEGTSASEISQFIFNEVILKSGVLINEQILAARLGINFSVSKDWNKLLEILNAYKYHGVFKESHDRWWAYEVLNWWNSYFPDISIIRLDAEDRVKLIKEKFDLNELTVAQKIEKTTSTKFWTICAAYKKPLDPKDGFLVDGTYIHTWQDKKYVSLQAILERESTKLGLRIHSSEKERLEDIKQAYL